MLKCASNAAGSRSTVPPPSTEAVLAIGPYLHDAAARAGNCASNEHQVALGHHLDDRQATLGHPATAHPTGAANPLEHARRCRRRADRSGRADVVRAVGFGPAFEVVASDGPLKAFALRLAGDLDLVAGLKGLDGHGLADEQLPRLVAELHEVAVSRRIGLLQMPELGLGQRLLLAAAERELHGLVAVAVDRADPRNGARAGLEHCHALNLAVLEEPLSHA